MTKERPKRNGLFVRMAAVLLVLGFVLIGCDNDPSGSSGTSKFEGTWAREHDDIPPDHIIEWYIFEGNKFYLDAKVGSFAWEREGEGTFTYNDTLIFFVEEGEEVPIPYELAGNTLRLNGIYGVEGWIVLTKL
jgi:hypothetical protein